VDVPAELKIVMESFDRNSRVTRALLETLKMEDLDYSDGMGGFNVGQHLADIVEFRPGWLSRVSPEHAAKVPNVIDDKSSTWLKVESIEELQRAFDAGDAAVKEAVLAAVTEGRGFEGVYETHPAHFIQHCIVHDSHHRGQIMALLRQAGRPLEVRQKLENETWAMWRE
jgi:uncharacterized damage-inducible protein DinB